MLTKTDVINGVAEATGYTKTSIKQVIDALGDVVWGGLKEHEDVSVINGIKIKVAHRDACERRTPQGDIVSVPAKYVLKASFGKGIKDFINE